MKAIAAFFYNLMLSIRFLPRPSRMLMIFPLLLLSSLASGVEVPILWSVVRNIKTTETFQQDGWILSAQKDGVDVSYKVERCTGGKRVLLRIKNSNATERVVDLACTIKSNLDIVIPSIKNTVPARTAIEGNCADSPAQTTFIAISEQIGYSGILFTIK